MKNTIILVAVAVTVLAVGSAIYERFFSDKAQLIKVLEEQIKERDARIDMYQKILGRLEAKEKEQLERIAELKERLDSLSQQIDTGEAKIDEVKAEFQNIEEAIEAIENSERGSVARSRDIVESSGDSAGS